MRLLTKEQIVTLPNWAEQLAEVTRLAWTGHDGTCYFPYKPLTQSQYWIEVVLPAWHNDSIHSWAMVEGTQIIAHAAFVKKNGIWECGRWVALPQAPKGTMSCLVTELFHHAQKQKWQFQVECTQAHTASEKICRRLGLRFAGIGILEKIDNIWWDIIYFDNLPHPDFSPVKGTIGNPLGQKILVSPFFEERLKMIHQLITTKNGEDLPPKFFHILPELEPTVRQIIALNL
ncbi:MAG: GNAT family protein [Candidatus Magasanikbacteria bacterium]|nr:GNAT family protein [Candidatus Magasanikbacteria bacterium]